MDVFLFILLLSCSGILLVNSNEVIGCGGYIKTDSKLDFSKVEIKLLTKQRSLKDKIECSPANGYYFLPIYDKGEYSLVISPPPGWSFEPAQIDINFDGVKNPCPEDVNFTFKGFGITGKVVINGGSNKGAHNVNVKLSALTGTDERQTETDLNGIFSFAPVAPGKYIIRANHPRWQFSKAEHTVIVASGNTELPENSLIVSGFDVTGRVDVNDFKFAINVSVALARNKGNLLMPNCNNKQSKVEIQAIKPDYEPLAICTSKKIDNFGDFIFNDIPPGKYLALPIIQDKRFKVHFNVDFIEFEINEDSLHIKPDFKISAFSVTGKVLSGVGSNPLKSAIIKLNGETVSETDTNGIYELKALKPSLLIIHVEAPKMEFKPLQLEVEISQPILPTIVPFAYEVCGNVVSESSYPVLISNQDNNFVTRAMSAANADGEWCAYLPAGSYNIKVVVDESKSNNNVIQFFPLVHKIIVKDEPLSGIKFSKLRAVLNGKIKCLPDDENACTNAEIALKLLPEYEIKYQTYAKAGQYKFENILPGQYELIIKSLDNLCYDSTRLLVNVTSSQETAPDFIHHGYEVSVISSHRAILKYFYESDQAIINTINIAKGLNTFCVLKRGVYKYKLESCHLFDTSAAASFSTEQSEPLRLNAVAHKVGMRLLSNEPNEEFKLQIETGVDKKQLQLVGLQRESYKVEDKYAYRYEMYLQMGEEVSIRPAQSGIYIFSPESASLIGRDECEDIALNLYATRGLIIHGKVIPAVKDVKITLYFPENSEIQSSTFSTNKTGEFMFGPIDKNIPYELTAEKESYDFSAFDPNTNSFSGHKLCDITVNVKNDAGEALSGVLVSLSGGQSFRSNMVTNNEGLIKFHSLSPSQYFLRPILKEYKFEPNSKIIDVKDGESVQIILIGKRFAYSVFGTIRALNGLSYPGVNIEAVGAGHCMNQQEEAVSDQNGQYRLRGLMPNCSYAIHLKDLPEQRDLVERLLPSSTSIEIINGDLYNVDLRAIPPLNIVDVNIRITAAENDQYKTLRLIVYPQDESHSPIYSRPIPQPLNPKSSYNPGVMVYLPRMKLDHKTYIVELQSTLSLKSYTYKSPTSVFVANRNSIFLELDFRPEVRTPDPDINSNSLSALILVTLIAIAFYKQDFVVSFGNTLWMKATNLVANFESSRKQQHSKRESRGNDSGNKLEAEHIAAQQFGAIIKKKKTKKI